MAIKLTYSDGQESQYGDDTKWEVDDGVLKLGKKDGDWSVLLSPSHWAVIEVGGAKGNDDSGEKDEKVEAKKKDTENSKSDESKDDDED